MSGPKSVALATNETCCPLSIFFRRCCYDMCFSLVSKIKNVRVFGGFPTCKSENPRKIHAVIKPYMWIPRKQHGNAYHWRFITVDVYLPQPLREAWGERGGESRLRAHLPSELPLFAEHDRWLLPHSTPHYFQVICPQTCEQ